MTEGKKILVLTENLDEFSDLSRLFDQIDSISKENIFFFEPLLGGLRGNFSETLKVQEYKHPNVRFDKLKFFTKILIVFELLFFIKKNNIKILITGVPLFVFRVLPLLAWKMFHISYIRGILLPSAILFSKYHILYNNFPKVVRYISPKRLSPYYSDHIFTINEINLQSLTSIGIGSDRISICMPISQSRTKIDKNKRIKLKRIIFIMQAFEWHKMNGLHKMQNNFIKNLCDMFLRYKLNYQLVFKLHPRDSKNSILSYIKKSGFSACNQPANQFLNLLNSKDILISYNSTLALESIFSSARVLFYTCKNEKWRNDELYKQLNISPFYTEEEVLNKIKNNNLDMHIFRKGIKYAYPDGITAMREFIKNIAFSK